MSVKIYLRGLERLKNRKSQITNYIMDDPASLFLLFAAELASVETPTLLTTILNFLLVLFLVLGNGFFVASEFALVAVRKSRIEALVA